MKQKIAFALIMGFITTGSISFTLVSLNIGFTKAFLGNWFRSWLIAYVVVVPVIVLFGSWVQALIAYLFKEKPLVPRED
ncbi:DUF2798 domain-containing protein [Spirosoma endbachense]|uniref:DUF2798 domain-containing protein n=1 Tax=Spirosoma endbachense TaxID=2666025 RepID=A0A6P1W7X8_9BACT|nr:DUF2798 domain-containing protein [Spirosoma endbachense]QHW00158.1 DUF2798 domain-containing protein [Spirosoma endbachense]